MALPPLINASIAYSQMGEPDKAQAALQRAVALAPDDAPSHYNLGLLLAERKDMAGAEKHLRAALASDPAMAEAAFNLSLLMLETNADEALQLSRKASKLRPDNPRFAYTLALLLYRAKEPTEALQVLQPIIQANPNNREAIALYAEIMKQSRPQQ